MFVRSRKMFVRKRRGNTKSVLLLLQNRRGNTPLDFTGAGQTTLSIIIRFFNNGVLFFNLHLSGALKMG